MCEMGIEASILTSLQYRITNPSPSLQPDPMDSISPPQTIMRNHFDYHSADDFLLDSIFLVASRGK